MIYKTAFMDDRKRCNFTQKNNGWEAALGEYETCGPTSFVSGLNAVGYNTHLVEGVQDEDIVMAFFMNEGNYPRFKAIRSNLDPKSFKFCNRVPQYYAYMAEVLFSARAIFSWGPVDHKTIKAVKEKCAVHLCFDYGHFVAGVGYDSSSDELIYNDPLNGFNLRLAVSKMKDEFKNFLTVIYPKE